MPINSGLFTAHDPNWATPDALFKDLDAEFHFTIDVCASPDNAKCDAFLSLDDGWSGLAVEWAGVCWMNPPYGRHIGRWIEKAYCSSLSGATVVCLLPSRTDTAWWHDYVMKASEIRFIRGRLKFGDATWNAPFPSAIIVFR